MLRNLFVLAIVLVGLFNAWKGAFYVLLFYMWVAYFRPESWVWGGSIVQDLDLSLIAGLVLLVAVVLSATRPRVNSVVVLIVLFAVHGLLSTVLSSYFDYAFHYWQEFAKAALISCLVVALTTDRPKYRLLLLVIAWSLGFEGAKEGWAQFVLNPGSSNTNSHPLLGDNNGVALGMLMIVPLFGALAQTATRPLEKYAHRFMLVGVFLRAIASYSRGAFLSSGALILIYLLRSKHKIRAVASMALVAALVLPVMPPAFWDRMRTITAPAEARDESAQGRLYIWQVGMAMGNDHPFTGVGFNSFSQAYNKYDPSGGTYGGSRASHSTWFGTLGDLGYPGLLMLVFLILISMTIAHRVRRITRGKPELEDLRIFGNAIETSLIVFVVGGTFLPSQYSEMLWHFFGLAAALQFVASEAVAKAAPVVDPTPALPLVRGTGLHGS